MPEVSVIRVNHPSQNGRFDESEMDTSSAAPVPSSRSIDSKPKHPVSTNPSPYGNEHRNGSNIRRDISDFQYSESDDCETNFSDIPYQPKCCYVGVVNASIGSVLATVAVTILLSVYLFVVLKGRSGIKAGPTSFGLIGTLLAICTVLILFAIAFIYGAVKGRKRWLWPLMILSMCFCVASIGTFAAITITAADDISETVHNATEHQTLIIVNIVIFRVAFVILIILQIFVIVCYIRCYRYISKLSED